MLMNRLKLSPNIRSRCTPQLCHHLFVPFFPVFCFSGPTFLKARTSDRGLGPFICETQSDEWVFLNYLLLTHQFYLTQGDQV